MADPIKNTQEAGRAVGAQPVATPQIPERRESSQPSTMAAQRSTDKTRQYGQESSEGPSKMTEINEMVDQAKETVTDAYNRASRSVNETLEHAKEYGRENPGTTTLVAFGAGVGVGLLLASGVFSSQRSRSQRVVQPVMNALTEVAWELFRR